MYRIFVKSLLLMKNKVYLIILVVSLLLTFAVGPFRMFCLFENPPLYLGTLIRGIVFWMLTVYFLSRYSGVVEPYKIVLLVLLADLVPDIIVRVFMGHFMIALPSFPDTILQIIVVLLGWWYTRLNKLGKVALALVNLLVCIGVSSYGFVRWNELGFVKDSGFKKLEIVELLDQAESTLSQDSVISQFQDKNLIVYVGGEDDERNKIGLTFLQKVQKEFEGNNGTTALALIYLNDPESRTSDALLSENINYPIVRMEQDESQLENSVLYHWYVVDRNKEIRWRKKIHLQENGDIQKERNELQFLRELIAGLNENAE